MLSTRSMHVSLFTQCFSVSFLRFASQRRRGSGLYHHHRSPPLVSHKQYPLAGQTTPCTGWLHVQWEKNKSRIVRSAPGNSVVNTSISKHNTWQKSAPLKICSVIRSFASVYPLSVSFHSHDPVNMPCHAAGITPNPPLLPGHMLQSQLKIEPPRPGDIN